MSIYSTIDDEVARPSTAFRMHRGELFFFFAIIFGSILNVVAYGSFEVLLVFFFFFLFGFFLTANIFLGGSYERKMYWTTFSVTWILAGVSAIYANWLGDVGQNNSDAASFYELAAGKLWKMDLEHLEVLSEGSIAIRLWGSIYDLFAVIGLEKGRYIGILTNMSLVSLSGVIGIRICKLIFGNSQERLDRFILLFSSCGIFWLYAAIHLRDSLVLFVITGLLYTWVRWLTKYSLSDFVLALTLTVLSGVLFRYLRDNFVSVPLIIGALAFGCSLTFKKMNIAAKAIAYVFLILLVVSAVILGEGFLNQNVEQMLSYREGYTSLSTDSHSSGSLGVSLILSQPILIRAVLGSGYLFLFPIPFWTGFQLESAYALLKSTNVIYFYFLTPLFLLSIRKMWRFSNLRTSSSMFLLSVVVGFTIAVSITSLETRHFGVFLVPAMIISLIPDLSSYSGLKQYKNYLALYLSLVAILHLSWAIIKF
jgi:hypothetical protein